MLTTGKSKAQYPQKLRRVIALVELDGQRVETTLLTNNVEWSAQTIADLHPRRGRIETALRKNSMCGPCCVPMGQPRVTFTA